MPISVHDLSGTHTKECYVVAHAAATATENHPIFTAPFSCKVTNVKVIAATAVTGQGTNTTHLNIFKQATTPVEIGNYDLTAGNNLAAMTVKDIDVTDTAFAEDDVLYLQHQKVGNGLAVPELLVQVEFQAA